MTETKKVKNVKKVLKSCENGNQWVGLTCGFIRTEMRYGQAYPISEQQVERVKLIWNILHLNADFELKFSDDYKQIKKIRI